MAGKSGKSGGKKVIKSPGKPPIKFQPGGLHQSTGTPAGQPIPAAKMQAALNGKLGPRAAAQARFAKNVLGVKTGAKGAKKGATRGR